MGETRVPGPLGLDSADQERFFGTRPSQRHDPSVPGPAGNDVLPLSSGKITKVVRNYDESKPVTTGGIEVTSAVKIADVFAELNQKATASGGGEWGKGGAADIKIVWQNQDTGAVELQATLLKVLPTWQNKSKGTKGAQASWDKMIAKLENHEQKHLDIALEHLNKMIAELESGKIDATDAALQSKHQEWTGKLKKAQDAFDTDSDHGAKEGHAYGDVILDVPDDGG